MDSTAFAAEILDGLPFGVALFDTDGTCLAVNSVLQDLAAAGTALCGSRVDTLVASCFGVDRALQARGDFGAVMQDGLPRASREWADRQGMRRFDCMWRRSTFEGRPMAVLGVVDVTPHCERREALEERAQLSAGLTGIETTLSYTTDFDDILSVLAADVPDGFECTSALALCSQADGWEIRHVRGVGRGLVGRVYQTSRIPNADESISHRRPTAGRIVGATPEWGDGEALTVPLAASGEIAALLVLTGRRLPFSRAALEYADKLATIASFAVENARLHEADRETREALQTALLGVVTEVPGVRLGHLYRSATRRARVGGDFYELFAIDDDRVGILMGDVSGKGLDAASLAALVKTTVKIHAKDLVSPAAVLAKTNEVLLDECDSSRFVTAFYALLNTATGGLQYCSGGHPPPLLRRADGTTSALREGSPILGAYPGLLYEDRRTVLANGDVVLLYTDGVTEARREREQYGEERLLSLVASLSRVDARELPEIVFEEVFEYVRGALSDDMAILALSPTAVGSDQPQQRLPL